LFVVHKASSRSEGAWWWY